MKSLCKSLSCLAPAMWMTKSKKLFVKRPRSSTSLPSNYSTHSYHRSSLSLLTKYWRAKTTSTFQMPPGHGIPMRASRHGLIVKPNSITYHKVRSPEIWSASVIACYSGTKSSKIWNCNPMDSSMRIHFPQLISCTSVWYTLCSLWSSWESSGWPIWKRGLQSVWH